MIHERVDLRDDGSAYITTYIVDDPIELERKRPVVVICPGGAYAFCSSREGEPVALAFNAAGFHAVVVNYRVNTLFPAALTDLSDAVCEVRKRAEQWRIDTDKVIVCGFSAGGHLAASLGVFYNSETAIMREDGLNKPDGLILGYPVISSGEKGHKESIRNIAGDSEEIAEKMSLENHVTDECPPAFIWHSFTDAIVPVQNSIYMAEALADKHIPVELHIFPNGPHGMSVANEFVAESESGNRPEVQKWIGMAVQWINNFPPCCAEC